MGAATDFTQNFLIDALYRGGALNSAGTVNSTATVKGVWAATTAYAQGDTVVPPATFTAGGGKFLRCTTAGTSGSTTTLACPAVGSTLSDGTVTWTAVSGVPCPSALYVALMLASKGTRLNSTAYALNDTLVVLVGSVYKYYKVTTAGTSAASLPGTYLGAVGEVVTDGTAVMTEQSVALDAGTAVVEVSGGNYARQLVTPSLANFAGTQSGGSTTASTGTLGLTSNNAAITWGVPSANWNTAPAQIWGWALYDQLTGGNLLDWAPLTTPQSVLNGQAAPSMAIGTLTSQIGT